MENSKSQEGDLSTGTIQDYLDLLTSQYTQGPFYEEVQKAKEEFFLKAGKVYEDDPEFESRMCIFMDWYLFERDLKGIDIPPVKHHIRNLSQSDQAEEKQIYDDLAQTIHSIFEIQKSKKDKIILFDLFARKKFDVLISHHDPLLTKSEVFEGRLLPFRGNHYLSDGICIHPAEAKKFISKKIKKIRHLDKTQQKKFILELTDMKLKYTRFSHIDLKYIYTDHPTQNFLKGRAPKSAPAERQ